MHGCRRTGPGGSTTPEPSLARTASYSSTPARPPSAPMRSCQRSNVLPTARRCASRSTLTYTATTPMAMHCCQTPQSSSGTSQPAMASSTTPFSQTHHRYGTLCRAGELTITVPRRWSHTPTSPSTPANTRCRSAIPGFPRTRSCETPQDGMLWRTVRGVRRLHFV
jgi:hypothetical protein